MFSNYPKLAQICGAEMKSTALAVFMKDPFFISLKPEDVEKLNRDKIAYHDSLVAMEPKPQVISEDMHYENQGYTGTVTVHRPTKGESLPILFYFHGGAFTIMQKENYDFECQRLAEEGNCVVFNVEYRPALEGFTILELYEDCYAAILEGVKQAGHFHGDPEKIAVAGDSAGGSIAAGMTILCRDRKGPKIGRQFLLYMGAGFDLSDIDNGNDSELGTANIVKVCFKKPEDSQLPYITPMYDKDMASLPPTTFIDGTCDFILEDTLHYSRALIDAGVDVTVRLYEGIPHGFFYLNLEESKDCIRYIGEVMRETFS